MSAKLLRVSFELMYHRSITILVAAFAVVSQGCSPDVPAANAETAGTLTHAQLLKAAKKFPPSECAEDFKFMAASAALGGAEEQIAKGDYRRANIRLRDGLEALGEVPLGNDVLDDTGQRLSFAWSEEWNGRLEAAAKERQQILAGRLSTYAELQNLRHCPTPAESTEMRLPL